MTGWRKGRRCDSNTCVEVHIGADAVRVRNTRDAGVVLTFSPSSWAAFVAPYRRREGDT